ncbi:MAG TPA: ATP-binding protein, partial [Burkholderiaceae bacterium]|nr:ATP-binding protein [Burkholderiaceae bacterium]
MNTVSEEFGAAGGGRGAVHGPDRRAVRLNDAAVGLIEPLMSQQESTRIAALLADAVQRWAAADSQGLRSLNYLAALVVPFLKQRASDGLSTEDRENIELWVGDLVAFCAGQLVGRDSQQLVTGLGAWRGFPKVPAQFVELIGERLRADAVVIAGWNAGQGKGHETAPAAAEPPAGGAAAAMPAVASTPAGPPPEASDRGVAQDAADTADVLPVADDLADDATGGDEQDAVIDDDMLIGEAGDEVATGEAIDDAIGEATEDAIGEATDDVTDDALIGEEGIGEEVIGGLTDEAAIGEVADDAAIGEAAALPEASGDAPPASAETTVMARDELDMLADAAEALGADVIPQLLSLPLPVDHDSPRQDWQELLEEFESRIGHLANAAGYVGAEGLVRLLNAIGEQLRAWRLYGAPLNEDTRRLLMLTPDTLARYFGAPQQDTADELAGLMVDAGWPQPLPIEDCAMLAMSLASLEVIDSRQVTVDENEISESDLSLQIPPDADRSVVEHLLQELPVLSGEFSESIDALRGGAPAELQRAQRLAHTLKGSANTVGVRGIANLTHRLEDILQLLVKADRLPPRALRDHLAEAADCLAEMCEAVAGVGTAPDGSMTVYRRSVDWINRLLNEGVPGDDAAQPEAAAAARGEPGAGRAAPSAAGSAASSVTEPSAPSAIEPEVSAAASMSASIATEVAGDEGAAAPARSPEPAERPIVAAPEEELLRVPGRVVDRLLDVTGEAVITLAQLHQQIALIDATRVALRAGSERLQELSGELERLVDVRGLALTGRGRDQRFDALELDEYNDLHTVSRRIAEAAADNKLLDQQFDRQVGSLRDFAAQLERIQTDLREQSMRTRMVPMAMISARLQRAMRQAARMAGKQVALTIQGETTEIDAHLLQSLVDPLTHMLRNAVDHGIEGEAERLRAGKPAGGHIEARFSRDASNLIIEISDDGRGLDVAAIRERAAMLGLIDDDAAPADEELMRLILLPGFSTRREATQLSGRGIGLNVVHQRLGELRGRIDLSSRPGRGCTFRLMVPLRMASVPVMVARCATHVLALSVRDIERIATIDETIEAAAPTDLVRPAGIGGALGESLRVRCGDRIHDAVRLETLLRLPPAAFAREDGRQVALLVRQPDGQSLAVVAPELEQSRNVIVRPLPAIVPPVGGISGLAVLGDGTAAPGGDLPDL